MPCISKSLASIGFATDSSKVGFIGKLDFVIADNLVFREPDEVR
jgi:hypothetical protein